MARKDRSSSWVENEIDCVVCTEKVKEFNCNRRQRWDTEKKLKVVIVVHTKMCIAQWIRLEAKCWLVMFGQKRKTEKFLTLRTTKSKHKLLFFICIWMRWSWYNLLVSLPALLVWNHHLKLDSWTCFWIRNCRWKCKQIKKKGRTFEYS